ncbi:MAG: DASS family sodium-coupled anion symporter [Actinomycetaceae bacterium]|nr:DASS family sodium-coupled anion symporter [Actinomycetaceae bacterium]MDY6082751.1 DASS family sodium-coupled anion symporter [Actinomycetaceae bacterium]
MSRALQQLLSASHSLKLNRLAIAVIIGAAVMLIRVPDGVTAAGWRAFGLFVAFICSCILNAAGIGELAILLICALIVTKSMPIDDLLAGFGNSAVWLVLFAFFASIGFRNTRLGYRIAYAIIARIGNHPIALAYAISLCDVLIAPFVPNTNARGAGILFPITKALVEASGSKPDDHTEKKIGQFLMLASFHLNLIIGGLFLTSMSTNPLAAAMLNKTFHTSLTWGRWFLFASVPMLLATAVVPCIIYAMNKPTLSAEEMKAAPTFARTQLRQMGRLSTDEALMAIVFLGMIILWTIGSKLGIDTTTVAIAGVAALLVVRVVSYQDIVQEAKAWDILLWLAPLIAITGYLVKAGIIAWIVTVVQKPLAHAPIAAAFVILALIYFYIHYLLTSLFVHIQTFFLPFVGILASMGMNPLVVGMVFALLTCVSPGTTHYGTGTASIYYSTGYVTQKQWWATGFIVSLAELGIIGGVGFAWISLVA